MILYNLNKCCENQRLLMCLLSETSGLAHTFRILTVFDKHFQRQWRARDIKVIVDDDRDGHWKRRNNNAFQDREAEGEFYEVIDRSRRVRRTCALTFNEKYIKNVGRSVHKFFFLRDWQDFTTAASYFPFFLRTLNPTRKRARSSAAPPAGRAAGVGG